ncbi:MAG TPA: bifunctional [glutamine synthetase] adenylyltransferase/[glutamine synthetase]-adenylyl-L-tyrosine phosphorylase [Actinomycetes bacterium]|nr:bifunctional [glutamine synthetase] adenylyltransferase/[glutamine synthetase]-adenylyl-L-tyrosine phosphorylase [Actinomycetes bacterium]
MTQPTGRTSTLAGRLVRLGFADVARVEDLLADLQRLDPSLDDAAGEGLLDTLGDAADPDLALAGLVRVLEAGPLARRFVRDAVAEESGTWLRRLVAVLGGSLALGEHLARHPDQVRVLAPDEDAALDGRDPREDLLRAVGADPWDPQSRAVRTGAAGRDALRVAYRRRVLALAARDLVGELGVEHVAAGLAALADAALEAALRIAMAEHEPAADQVRLAIVAMGKCGGRELNYVSDVDVLFVAEPADRVEETAALAAATRLSTAVMQVCSAHTPEGVIWPVDANLRPEGRQGALVRTPASYLAYYERWASTWEFQALLKARPAAGDRELGTRFVDDVAPFVWGAAARPHFVEDVQAMRRRVEEHVPAGQAQRQIKLGRGGLRDVEFAVQLLQLVHGRTDVFLRSASTLEALEQLSTRGYVGRDDAAELDRAYRFLRSMEHRLQLFRMQRTHVVPDDEPGMRRLARSLGFREQPVEDLTRTWSRHAREVRRLHEKLFYRPLLNAVARLPAEEARLTPEAAEQRLEALGYADPERALRHIEALTSGVSRRAAIQQTLLPVMLAWFADHPNPDAGLLGFRQVSDALGSTPWYLRLLRDQSVTAERLAAVLASSRYASDLLLRAPEAVQLLASDEELTPRSREVLGSEMLALAGRYTDQVEAITAVRGVRRRELFRIACADLLGLLDVKGVGDALSDVTAAALDAGLRIATRAIEAERRTPLPTRVLVVAMGRFGGHELGYGSDADVMFVHDPRPGADERDAQTAAHAVAEEMRRLLAIPTTDPPLVVDTNLRPEGRNGPLVRTLASYAAYYARWSLVWEAQALLRAEPAAGDADLGQQFVHLVDPVRYPPAGLTEADVREVRRIKARVEGERLPRAADATLHTKLGRGGLADVEWTIQLLQLRHGADVPALRTTRTLQALAAGVAAGLMTPEDASVLAHAWETATSVRNAITLVRGRASDTLPSDVRELAAVARVVGYSPGRTGDLVEDYRRTTRRARAVVERVFYA